MSSLLNLISRLTLTRHGLLRILHMFIFIFLSFITTKSLDQQKEVLNKSFEDWKGNLGQVDDVTIIGIKI